MYNVWLFMDFDQDMAGKTFILFLDSFRQLPKLGYLVHNRFIINIEWFLSKFTMYPCKNDGKFNWHAF